jgi:protein-tyrosine phosphatase
MDLVAEGLVVGARREAIDPEARERLGIGAVLTLYESGLEDDLFPGVDAVLQLPIPDGRPIPSETIRRATTFIREQRALGRTVLVACSGGRSRSATMAAAYLHEEGADLVEAYLTLVRNRRVVLPHPELVRCLIAHYDLTLTVEEFLTRFVAERKRLREG